MNIDLSNITSEVLTRAVQIKGKIEELTHELGQLLGSTVVSVSISGGKKRRMSAAGRAAIAAGQKARWAKKNGKPAAKKRRKMSPAAKARISAAAKLRWKAAKAAGKSRL
jgi:hypothetical protein